MLKLAIIAEGVCDQIVIENILLGYFQDEEEEPRITYVQPRPATSTDLSPPGGWTLVFQSLKAGEPQKALQFNDYLVIHIDTDVQEEAGFDVPRRENGKVLSPPERVKRVIARLETDIDEPFYRANGHRIIFAVAVDTIECWLLPLLYDDKKAAKITGCLQAANKKLRTANNKGLSAGDMKFPPAYELASRDYMKRRKLMERHDSNPSLKLFIDRLDALPARQAAPEPADREGPSGGEGEGEQRQDNTASNPHS